MRMSRKGMGFMGMLMNPWVLGYLGIGALFVLVPWFAGEGFEDFFMKMFLWPVYAYQNLFG